MVEMQGEIVARVGNNAASMKVQKELLGEFLKGLFAWH